MTVAAMMKYLLLPTLWTRMPKGPLNRAVAIYVMVTTLPAVV